MAKKNKIYVLTMYRWSDKESRSYVECAGFSKSQMIDMAEGEEVLRGGKYGGEVMEFTPGDNKSGKVVRKMRTFEQIVGINNGGEK